jgi:hypothetical protein
MIDRSDYPTEPGCKALGPSADAAEAIADVAGTLRDQVRSTIAAAPQGSHSRRSRRQAQQIGIEREAKSRRTAPPR